MADIWDERMLALAEHVATWGKDPSTKTGAVIVRQDRTIVSAGYNGFPRGVVDATIRLNDREKKLQMTVHAEVNAIVTSREPLHGYTLYVHPWPPCGPCAAVVIQSGIKRIVTILPTEEQLERWGDSMDSAKTMLSESGVNLEYIR